MTWQVAYNSSTVPLVVDAEGRSIGAGEWGLADDGGDAAAALKAAGRLVWVRAEAGSEGAVGRLATERDARNGGPLPPEPEPEPEPEPDPGPQPDPGGGDPGGDPGGEPSPEQEPPPPEPAPEPPPPPPEQSTPPDEAPPPAEEPVPEEPAPGA